MANKGSPADDDDVFEGLLKKEGSSVQNRTRPNPTASNQAANDVLASNQSLPVTINCIQIHGAKNTRRSFLDPMLKPVLNKSLNADFTLGDLTDEAQRLMAQLSQTGIFKPEMSLYLSQPPQFDPNTSPTDLDVSIRVYEAPRITLKTGTEAGNSEGSAFGSLTLRNMFGGAEALTVNASAGTRTRSAYNVELAAPLGIHKGARMCFDGSMTSTVKPWASHEELATGFGIRYLWANQKGDRFQAGQSHAWRQVTGLAAKASPTIRRDAGYTSKNAISYMFTRDRRDNPMLPQSGYMIKTVSELAGWGPLGGDVAFTKSEFEVSAALPLSLPARFKGLSGISIGAGLRAGMLYPLPLSYGFNGADASRVNDRFILGGPTDVRGFSLGGMGPRDGPDAIGGDIFTAFNVNMLMPLPRLGPDSPFRLQVFANSGRLVAMRNDGDESMTSGTVAKNMISATKDIVTGMPSISAGFGLVYGHPAARFELNFCLPLVMRRGEVPARGLQVGVGLSFL
ncbi:outer membrane protein, OMP85 family [Xylariaceae sp. FL1272]|nr:outer membrane protein, OMP85 family [Xylariaceae sp. FL1272]